MESLGRFGKPKPWQLPVALLTASSVIAAGLPAHAFPDVHVNLIRISSEGVTAMPGPDQARLQVSAPAPVSLISQALPPAGGGAGPTLLVNDGTPKPLVMTYAGPLPAFSLDNYISIRDSNDKELEQIRFDSSAVVISPDRRTITITPTRPVEEGQTLAALLPRGNYVLPLATSSCFFQLAPPAPPVAALPPAPPPPPFPVLPVLLGIGAAALIGCAIGGCFSGNGGTNTSSN
jgi:hypothetical protein